MALPLRQQFAIARYVVAQHLRGRERYPLVLMLEPLFQCNLACAGCGKIDYPKSILKRRLPLEDCLAAVDECGAPVVSIPGGEPLIHPQIAQIVEGIVARRKYVYLCTNALLLAKKLDQFTPSRFLCFSVHLDGLRDHHDRSVCQDGVFDRAVAAIRLARERGFRVSVNATFFDNIGAEDIAAFLDYARELDIEGVTMSPGYAYERAPDQEHFLNRRRTKELFRRVFELGRGRRWSLSHSNLYLDFLAGNQRYECTPWSNPTRNIFGWQRPCYLLNEGYAQSFDELMRTTAWHRYGTGNYEKCANCMAHCGYEGSAVVDSIRKPWKALIVALRGIRTHGTMAEEIALSAQRPADRAAFERLVHEQMQSEPGPVH